jgi:hypothetical protein
MSFDPTIKIQEVILKPDAFKFKCPFALSISGPSMAGKSNFILKLLQNHDAMFDCSFKRVIYCQPSSLVHRSNDYFNSIKAVFPSAELVSGLPSISKLHLDFTGAPPSLLIIDDLQTDFLNSPEMLELLTAQIHHFGISCIFTLQSYYGKSKFGKSLLRNVTYKCFFLNRLDRRELKYISMEIAPNSPNFMESNFNFLFENFPRYSQYILIDGHFASTVPHLYVRSNIFPSKVDNIIRPIIFFPNPQNNKF